MEDDTFVSSSLYTSNAAAGCVAFFNKSATISWSRKETWGVVFVAENVLHCVWLLLTTSSSQHPPPHLSTNKVSTITRFAEPQTGMKEQE